MQVSQIMIEPVTIDKDQRLSYALETLNKKGIERLVVVQDGAVKGILTYADIADRLGVSEQMVSTYKKHIMADYIEFLNENVNWRHEFWEQVLHAMKRLPIFHKKLHAPPGKKEEKNNFTG